MTARETEELRRLRLELYRPGASRNAVERYERALAGLGGSEPVAEVPDGPSALEPERLPRAGRRVAVAIASLLIVATGAVAVVQATQVPEAEPLTFHGSSAAADLKTFDAVLRPATGGAAVGVVDAVRRSPAGALRRWRYRPGVADAIRGVGPLRRSFAGTALQDGLTVSLIVVCAAPTAYRWTFRGTTRGDSREHVLATATSSRCSRIPTAATSSFAVGTTLTSYSVEVPKGRRWGIAFMFGPE